MIRIIKFRAWNKRLKRMFSVYCINWQTGIIQCTDCITGTSHTFGMIDCELMQFTGRSNKSGEQLYDGDIVERDNYKGVVVFELNAWKFKVHEDSFSIQYPSFYSNARTMDTIGNIYRSPELLTPNI